MNTKQSASSGISHTSPAAVGFLQRRDDLLDRLFDQRFEQFETEVAADHGRDVEHLPGGVGEA